MSPNVCKLSVRSIHGALTPGYLLAAPSALDDRIRAFGARRPHPRLRRLTTASAPSALHDRICAFGASRPHLRLRLTWANAVEGGVGVIDAPVEPVIFE